MIKWRPTNPTNVWSWMASTAGNGTYFSIQISTKSTLISRIRTLFLQKLWHALWTTGATFGPRLSVRHRVVYFCREKKLYISLRTHCMGAFSKFLSGLMTRLKHSISLLCAWSMQYFGTWYCLLAPTFDCSVVKLMLHTLLCQKKKKLVYELILLDFKPYR